MIQKKIADFLFSTRLMAVLFIVFAVAMAVGTFIEDSYSTEFARIYVYNAKWFELIMVLFCINFFGNIKKQQLWRKEKLITLIFHLSFLLIIIGAGVTRYISFEGLMPIENGETVNTFYSGKTYLTTYIDGETDEGMLRKKKNFPVLLAEGANNHHTFKTDFKGQPVEFEITEFIKEAKRTVVENPDGKRYLKIVNTSGGQRNDNFLEDGQVGSINNLLVSFNKETDGAINIKEENGEYTIDSPFPGTYMRMADQKEGVLVEDSVQTLQLASLYNLGGLQFVIPEETITGKYEVIKAEEGQSINDAIVVNIKSEGKEEQKILMGNNQSVSNFTEFELADLDIHLRYGSKEYELPYSIHLHEFIAEKYPGTADNPNPSYSSFKSRVTLSDMSEKDTVEIYMNHVLDHKGYRFFQASFMPNEEGTVLSVNHDYWGTTITYIGYTLLYIGMLLILFVKGSRFTELAAQLQRMNKNKRKRRSKYLSVLAIVLLSGSLTANAQVRKEDVPGNEQTEVPHDSIQVAEQAHDKHAEEETKRIVGADLSTDEIIDIIIENRVPKKQADEFGKLVIQDFRGRMKPINTYSSELLRKLSRKDHYEDPATGETILSSDQFLISLTQNPMVWYTVPLIKIKLKDERLTDILDVDEDQKLVKFIQFFDDNGDYKLGPYLEEAYRAKVKSRFQKDLVDADGQVNLLHNAMQGVLLQIFPIPDHDDNKWLSHPDVIEQIDEFKSKDSLFVRNALPLYMGRLYDGTRGTSDIEKGDYTQAHELLEGIKAYQHKYGAQILPSDQHVKAEVLYNKYDVFKNMFSYYLYAGLILFILVILEIFYPRKWMLKIIGAGKIAVLLLFIAHTLGLAARWYISGHAPWSDAYESVIFVAWATVLFGLIFGRKSDLTIAATAFVTSMILMVAHWNWMDPSIANLEPVLDSYWIMIHTSVIVASYGPFTLGAILGLVCLLLMIFTNKDNVKKMKLNIRELTIINEMALTVGLVLLTIGNFLGGQWANESWGRYWSWDPKETWALISIMVYAFVIHMRLVPGMRSRFAFNWISILALGSILMTYFGVNFYLSGLHSYASGDQIISYNFILLALGIWIVLGGVSYWKFKKFYKKPKKK